MTVSIRSQHWRDRAACRDADPGLFFPEAGESARPAMAICAGCPVRAECLRYAFSFPEPWGVWGGTAERDRRRPRAAAASRFRGVAWHKPLGKWTARATLGGRRVHLGVFEDETDAARAVLEAEGALPEVAAASTPQPEEAAA